MFAVAFLVSDSGLYTVWGIVLAVAVVLVLVVAALLLLILAAARAIELQAGRCLAAAAQIVANTAPIWALDEVNGVASDIEVTAQSIERNGADVASALAGPVHAQ